MKRFLINSVNLILLKYEYNTNLCVLLRMAPVNIHLHVQFSCTCSI